MYDNNIENLETADADFNPVDGGVRPDRCKGNWKDLVYYIKAQSLSPDLGLPLYGKVAKKHVVAGTFHWPTKNRGTAVHSEGGPVCGSLRVAAVGLPAFADPSAVLIARP